MGYEGREDIFFYNLWAVILLHFIYIYMWSARGRRKRVCSSLVYPIGFNEVKL